MKVSDADCARRQRPASMAFRVDRSPDRRAGDPIQLEQSRLTRALVRVASGSGRVVEVERPTPLAFPLLVDRAREQLTSEKLADRIRRMAAPLEQAAEGTRFRRGGTRGFRSG